MNYKFNAKLVVGLVVLEILLTVSYLLDTYYGKPFWTLHIFLDLDSETSFPAWFSTMQLFLVGLLLGVLAYLSEESKLLLYCLALGFVFLSMDEATQVHEGLIPQLVSHVEVLSNLFGKAAWMVIYLGIALGVLLVFYKQVYKLLIHYPREAYIFILGLVVFITGGLVVELVHFSYFSIMTELQNGIQVAVEEFLEMLGITIVLYSILNLILNIRSHQ